MVGQTTTLSREIKERRHPIGQSRLHSRISESCLEHSGYLIRHATLGNWMIDPFVGLSVAMGPPDIAGERKFGWIEQGLCSYVPPNFGCWKYGEGGVERDLSRSRCRRSQAVAKISDYSMRAK